MVETFGILPDDINACKESQEINNAEQSARIEEVSEKLHGFRRAEDINDAIPEIDDKVNPAVEGILGSV